ncbi:MAG: hypothetical protein H6772_04065 [Pseudomonadales bacterium]|nr:hypothetical protein [Pseudomonadales bacterium]
MSKENLIIIEQNNLLLDIIKEIESGLLEKYVGHGISRGTPQEQYLSLISILQTGRIIGNWATLLPDSYEGAYSHGSFLLLSYYGKNLVVAEKLHLNVVIVNGYFESQISELEGMFPEVTFIHAKDFNNWIINESKILNRFKKLKKYWRLPSRTVR